MTPNDSIKADIELALMQREQQVRDCAARERAWVWVERWLRMQGDGMVIASQVVTVMESRLRQELAK